MTTALPQGATAGIRHGAFCAKRFLIACGFTASPLFFYDHAFSFLSYRLCLATQALGSCSVTSAAHFCWSKNRSCQPAFTSRKCVESPRVRAMGVPIVINNYRAPLLILLSLSNWAAQPTAFQPCLDSTSALLSPCPCKRYLQSWIQ